MLWSPARVALLGIAVWLAIRLSAPLEARIGLSGTALLFIMACYTAFFVGCLIADRLRKAQFALRPNLMIKVPAHFASARLELITAILGLVGIALRYFDRGVLRGVSYGAGSLEVREALASSSVGLFGVLGSLLFPLCLVPFLLMIQRGDLGQRKVRLILSTVLFALPMIESFGQLSRSIMLITVVMLVMGVLCTRYDGRLFKPKVLLSIFAGAGMLLLASTLIFEARLNNESRSLDTSILTSVYSELIAPDEDATQAMLAGSELESSIYKGILTNSLYYTSGMYEFSILWDRIDLQDHSYGTYMLQPIFRGVDLLLGTSFLADLDEADLVYRLGVFNTFFGPIWIDFSYFSLPIMILFGYFCTIISFKAKYENRSFFPAFLILNGIVFYMPVVNFISNGLGLFFVMTFLIFAFISKFFAASSGQSLTRPHPQTARVLN